ncbi:hypothetical protein V497_01933, partial [Pseudogymnoascus sp. VKM F-4516 (FW-969)]
TTTTLSRPFADWFDSAGHFVALPFQQMLAGAAPVIGKADPGRVGKEAPEVAALRETVEEAVRASGSAVGSVGGEGRGIGKSPENWRKIICWRASVAMEEGGRWAGVGGGGLIGHGKMVRAIRSAAGLMGLC